MDDILITGSHNAFISKLIANLGSKFALTDLGPILFFLGLEVCRTTARLILSQKKYI